MAAQMAKRLFSEYYKKVDADSISPDMVPQREFGFGDFEKKIAFRHMAFKTPTELKKYFVENAPPFASYSSAVYERPDARPMEAKGWLGSELLFDLDATDMRLRCQEIHGKSWVCKNCLNSVRQETVRLVEDFLVPDFGFSKKEISVNFSGNRGYHVHVANNDVMKLDSLQRRQITEYIAGIGIDPDRFFTLEKVGKGETTLIGPKPTDGGWAGKFAKGVISALNTQSPPGGSENSKTNALVDLGVSSATAKKLYANTAEMALGISLGTWDKVKIPKKKEFWMGVIKNMAIKQSDSIDKNVTNDTHHLLRIPNTIHGDTGLVGKKVSLSALPEFDPMRDAIAFPNGTMKISVEACPQFTMNGELYGPFEKTEAELPTYAALYMILKRVATPL
jgi:DNA primase small subunit